MKTSFTIVIIIWFTFVTNVFSRNFTNVKLSQSAKVSLITCGSGDALYALFGHTAIRLYDDSTKVDLAFNYGTFDVETPNFLYKFIMGDLDYFLSVYPFHYFPKSYKRENRWVKEEVLNVDNKIINELFHSLLVMSTEQNKFYRYDFYYRNCATQIRDVVHESIPGLVYSSDSLFVGKSFRDEMNKHLNNSPWVHFGLNLLLGSSCDIPLTNWTSMYMPDNLSLQLSKSSIKHNESNSESLKLLQPSQILVTSNEYQANIWNITPNLLILTVFLSLAIAFYFLKKQALFNFIENLLFILFSFIGILVIFFSFISNQSICHYNYIILFLSPIYLLFFIRSKTKLGSWINDYLPKVVISLIILFFLSGAFKLQHYTLEVYLLATLTLLLMIKRILQNKNGASK